MKLLKSLLILPVLACASTEDCCTSCTSSSGSELLQDSNGNGVEDSVDIALGTSLDLNENAIPDEVEEDLQGN